MWDARRNIKSALQNFLLRIDESHIALKDPTTSTTATPSPPHLSTPYSQLHTPSPHITLLALSLLFKNHLCARFVLCLGLL